jgi:hypothetical protein
MHDENASFENACIASILASTAVLISHAILSIAMT